MAFNFQTINTGNSILDRIQSNISNAFNALVGPFLGGILIPSASVGTSATMIKHGLGRVPTVWTICDQNTQATVSRISWDTNYITLEASSACQISIWVN